MDCGSLPESLLESELFGYKKGAFTGAGSDKKGLFEEAHEGTIFLDEISNTNLNFQASLLRVLQEKEIRRVGDTATRKVNVRVIAATNRDLQTMVSEGSFREDLYYRLNVIPITLAPLQERKEDVTLLIKHFVEKYAQQHNKAIDSIEPALMEKLNHFHWPGNIRQLENFVNRMVIFADDNAIKESQIPPDIMSELTGRKKSVGSDESAQFSSLKELEDGPPASRERIFQKPPG